MVKKNELIDSYRDVIAVTKKIMSMTKWINHIEIANWNRRVRASMQEFPDTDKKLELIAGEIEGLAKFCIVHAPSMQSLEVCRVVVDFYVVWSKFLLVWGRQIQ